MTPEAQDMIQWGNTNDSLYYEPLDVTINLGPAAAAYTQVVVFNKINYRRTQSGTAI